MSEFHFCRVGMLCGMLVLAAAFTARVDAQTTAIDHKKILGSDEKNANCASCHGKEAAAWSQTHHARSLDQLKNGRAIADKLGLTPTYRKAGSCIECHSTPKGNDPANLELIAAVSCESCHGPAADWLKLHSDFGEGKTKETEDAAHKAERHRKTALAGMIRKDRLYHVAKNCFSCHLVPDEVLVNVGGHKVASDFELVSWSQGEVRHNYLNGETNKEATAERKRVMYVVGKLVDLEMSLQAAGKITEKGHYRAAILNRIRYATAAIDEILTLQEFPEIANALSGIERREDGSLILTDAVLKEGSAKIGAAARAIAETHDGSKLAKIDALIPKPVTFKGRTQP